MIGETIGNYRVTAKLGEGGMGAVFLAEHRVIGRKVAVKVLRQELAANTEMLRRFFLEARSTASLRHPALVDVLDYGFHANGSPYIVMEYIEGESLAARIERIGRLSIATTLEISHQIATGMGVAHAAGLVHRDLKPGNLLLAAGRSGQEGDTVKVLDFGIAKLMNPDPLTGPLTQMSAFLGTPLYMAPEQCLGAANVDHRADIYALGCMMYEMACGHPPFVSSVMKELVLAHLRGSPVAPRKHRRDIPTDLEAVILKALAKEPASRQKNMAEVAEQLDLCWQKLAATLGAAHDGQGLGAGGTGRSIFPVSRSAKDSTGSISDEPPRTGAKKSRIGTRAAIAIGAIALCTAATIWMKRRASVEALAPESFGSMVPVATPPVTHAPSATNLPSAAGGVPVAEVPPTVVEQSSPAPTISPVKAPVAMPSRAPMRATPSDAATRSPPLPSRAPRATGQQEPPSLGGEVIENPWPN